MIIPLIDTLPECRNLSATFFGFETEMIQWHERE
jgi:hypothetical protein